MKKVDAKKIAGVALKVAVPVLVPIIAKKAAKSPLVRDIFAAIAREVLK